MSRARWASRSGSVERSRASYYDPANQDEAPLRPKIMRWMWIDRFLEFQSGRRAVARKNISLVEEEIDEYSPTYPYMPASLIIEGIAQTAGLLVGERSGFKDRVILAKVTKAAMHRMARPGDTLIYTAEV